MATLEKLLLTIRRFKDNAPSVDIYLFGSFLNPLGNSGAADIDLLILYEREADLNSVRRNVAKENAPYPLDILCMTYSEEKQFNFVQEQRARSLDSLLQAISVHQLLNSTASTDAGSLNILKFDA